MHFILLGSGSPVKARKPLKYICKIQRIGLTVFTLLCAVLQLQAQQQLSRLQAAAEAHSSNVADRDAFVNATAAKLGIRLPGASAMASMSSISAAAAAGGGEVSMQLQLAALDAFLSELRRRQAQLQGEIASMRESHR
jgi:cell division protein FtsB